jgi:hypothetical protein
VSNIIGWVAIGLLGCGVLVGVYYAGRSIGYERGRKSVEDWHRPKTMVHVHYPADEKEAQEILERLEKSAAEAKGV